MKVSKTTIPLKVTVNPSKLEVWSGNFQKIKEFYEANGHLTLPRTDPDYLRLSKWLTFQRHGSTSLRKDQLELLNSINYKATPTHQKRNDTKWKVRYNQLKQVYDETDGDKVKIKDSALALWLWKQKNMLRRGKLEPSREERLKKLGIDLSYNCKRKCNSKMYEEKWQSQFEKLKEYRRIKGDCNVPERWKEDSLGIWVFNQRMQYAQTKTGVADMNPDRIQKLEQIGFGWSVNDVSKKKERR